MFCVLTAPASGFNLERATRHDTQDAHFEAQHQKTRSKGWRVHLGGARQAYLRLPFLTGLKSTPSMPASVAMRVRMASFRPSGRRRISCRYVTDDDIACSRTLLVLQICILAGPRIGPEHMRNTYTPRHQPQRGLSCLDFNKHRQKLLFYRNVTSTTTERLWTRRRIARRRWAMGDLGRCEGNQTTRKWLLPCVHFKAK